MPRRSAGRRPRGFAGLRIPLLALAAAAWACAGTEGLPPFPPPDTACPGDAPADPCRDRLTSDSPLQDKNYYLLTLFQQAPHVADALRQDAVLEAMGREREQRLTDAAAGCGGGADCVASALLFSARERDEVGEALSRMAGEAALNCALVEERMRPSGMFQLHAQDPDAELLREAWADTAEGLQTAFDAYARSMAPEELAPVVQGVRAAHRGPLLFFEPLLLVVLGAMEAGDRDEAARYEPLEAGENRAALARVPGTDWDAYPYTAILVPGQGPERERVPLSPLGRVRCELAAERLARGWAPFVVLSGGHVHPDGTPYAEALEMKRFLMEEMGVPEEALFVDPHARHTTTNLRNFARLLVRYGLPADRAAVVTTDPFQALYIVLLLEERSQRELGYLPYSFLKQVGANDMEFRPDIRSLHADPRDPLDP